MTDLRKAIELRKQVSKSSTAKLDALVLRTSPDGRLRQNYRYYGAHTGRWSGEGVQPQNLPRGTVAEEHFEAAVEAVRLGDEFHLFPYGKTLDVISSTLRGAFRAPEGYTFVISDLSQIEVRVLAWVSDCAYLKSLLLKDDAYKGFASEHLYKVAYELVTKHMRQVAKSAVLGCGFQLSGGEEKEDENGDLIKTGLWGYAANMGIEMTRDEAHAAVKAYRSACWEVKKFWYAIEDACKLALQCDSQISCGPLTIGAIPNKLLWINLPSGRPLYYPKAELRKGEWPDGRPKTYISYYGVEAETKKFVRMPTYGGKLTENIVQAIARDVLAEAMLRIDDTYSEQLPIVGHSHDEMVCLAVKDGAEADLKAVEKAMTDPMPWAPDLELAASGTISDIYRK